MNDTPTTLSERADALAKRLDDKQAQFERHGVLDGETRLRVREASIAIAKLKERIAHSGELDVERHATDAANAEALSTQLDYWTAQIDREFKA